MDEPLQRSGGTEVLIPRFPGTLWFTENEFSMGVETEQTVPLTVYVPAGWLSHRSTEPVPAMPDTLFPFRYSV
jgi:hypothetical protein